MVTIIGWASCITAFVAAHNARKDEPLSFRDAVGVFAIGAAGMGILVPAGAHRQRDLVEVARYRDSLAGASAAHRMVGPSRWNASEARLVGMVTHVRDGDTVEVRGVPVQIANLDCAERGTSAGDRATALMRQLAAGASATCTLEGRRSYDREVGVCNIPGVGDVGEAKIRLRNFDRSSGENAGSLASGARNWQNLPVARPIL